MNQTVLVTGASRGIGAACAVAFAKRGYRVIVNYNKNKEAAEAVCAQIRALGGVCMCVQADVSDAAQVARMFSEAERFGGVDVLVNNAGIALTAMLCDTTPEMWREIFATNVDGVYHCSRAALAHMVSQKCGKIINVSSMWGQVGASCESAYSAAKAAVIGFTKALAKELGPSGITVNCVAPGMIETEMNAHLSKEDVDAFCEEIPLGCVGTPAQVAATVCFLASADAAYITGQVLGVSGGCVI